jgi:hypothetical protein
MAERELGFSPRSLKYDFACVLARKGALVLYLLHKTLFVKNWPRASFGRKAESEVPGEHTLFP